jgi:hypothetical protein
MAAAVVLGVAVITPPAFAQTRGSAGGRIGGGLAADGIGDRNTNATPRTPRAGVQSPPLGAPLSSSSPSLPSQSQQRMNERMNEGRTNSRARAQAEDEARARARTEMSPPSGLQAAPPLERDRSRPN